MDGRQVFERQRAAHFEGVSGAVVDLTLPLPERVVNDAIRGFSGAATRIRIREGNEIDVEFDGPWWLPFRSLRVQIAPDVVTRPSLVLRMRLVSPAVLAGGLLPTLAKALGVLPAAVRTEGSAIDVDLGHLLRQRGLGDLAALVASATVRTAASSARVALTIRVP